MTFNHSIVWGTAVSCLLSSAAAGQWVHYPTAKVPRTADGKPNLSAPAPRTTDGKPDLSGMWEMERTSSRPANFLGGDLVSKEFGDLGSSLKDGLPYQPWAAELMKRRSMERRVNDPESHCLPMGVMRMHTYPGLKKIIQVPSQLVILYEENSMFRQIMTDGRPLPAEMNPAWNGYSTGKWNGDTLVVESAGFRDDLWLDSAGHPMSDAAHITERFHRINYGNLEIGVTIDDPKTYTKPWSVTLKQVIKLDTELLEDICLEGERDLQHFVK